MVPPFSADIPGIGDTMVEINRLDRIASPEEVKKDFPIDTMLGEIEVKPVNR